MLDLIMPEMDGYEVLKHFQKDARLRAIPVIVISTLDDVDSIANCIDLGADDYLPKPFNPALLKARVDASLAKKRLYEQEQAHLVAEKRQTERALHESETRLETLVSSAPVIIFAVNMDGMLTLLEGKGLEVLDADKVWALGESVWDSSKVSPQLSHAIQRGLSGETQTTVVEIGKVAFEIKLSPTQGEDGDINGIIGVATDVTERLQRERELEAVVSFSSALRTILEQSELLDVILDQLMEILGIGDAVIALRDIENESTVFGTASGIWKTLEGKQLSAKDGVRWKALYAGEP
ncbi:MAG: response regulator, partial [Anaerolineae bacterium]|nr:response regulator [Anaerolineae bacterium]